MAATADRAIGIGSTIEIGETTVPAASDIGMMRTVTHPIVVDRVPEPIAVTITTSMVVINRAGGTTMIIIIRFASATCGSSMKITTITVVIGRIAWARISMNGAKVA